MSFARFCVTLACVVGALGLAAGQLDTVYDRANADVITSGRAAVASGDLRAVYQGATLLKAIEASVGNDVCGPVAEKLAGATSAEDIFYGVMALRSLGCDVKVKKAQRAVVNEAVASDVLEDIYYGAVAATVSKKKSLKVTWGPVVARVGKLMSSGGSFKGYPKDSSSSALNAGRAFYVLSLAAPKLKAGSDALDTVHAVADNIGSLFAGADGSEDTTLELGETDKLEATSLAVSGALALAAAAKVDVDVSAEQLTAFAAFFMSQSRSKAVDAAFNVVRGLSALADNSVAAPLVVRVLTPVLSDSATGADGNIRVAVSNVFGESVGAATVAVTALARGGKDAVLDDEAMTASAGSEYSVDFLGAQPEAAVYELELSVQPDDATYAAPEVIHRAVKVTTPASFGTAEVHVSSSSKLGQGKSTKASAAFPSKVSSTVKAIDGQHLHVLLDIRSATSGEPLAPHQVFVRLTNSETGVATIFVAAPNDEGQHHLSLNIGDRDVLHDAAAAGTYALDVIVGDSILENPTVWPLAAVSLKPPAGKPKPQKPLYAEPLLHESDTTLKALPEIHHQFRQPDPRPSALVSTVFTGLCLLPLLGLLVGLSTGGANLGNLPGGAGLLYVLGFHGSLGGILLLFVLYWVQLNMFQTLFYLTPLGVSAVFFGHRLLTTLARQQKVKAE